MYDQFFIPPVTGVLRQQPSSNLQYPMDPQILYEVTRRIGSITMNRPEKRNALSSVLVTALKDAFTRALHDEGVRVIMLSGNHKAFSSGADLDELKEFQSRSPEDNLADSQALMQLYSQIYHASKPVIALVEGYAVAGGCGLAVCCDFCYCTPEAKFGFPEVRIGFVPALVSVFLVRKIGEGRAREMLITGSLINADRALENGLVNAIFSAATIWDQTYKIAEDISANSSGSSISGTKQLIAASQGMKIKDALEEAARMNAQHRSSADCKKGISDFLSGKKMSW